MFCLEEAFVIFFLYHVHLFQGQAGFLKAQRHKKQEAGEGGGAHTKCFARGGNLYKDCEICFLFFLHGAWRSIEGVYFSRNGRGGKNQEARDLLL